MPDKVGAELKITKVLVKNLQKKREGIPSEVLTDDWEGIIHDPEISIVIELMAEWSRQEPIFCRRWKQAKM